MHRGTRNKGGGSGPSAPGPTHGDPMTSATFSPPAPPPLTTAATPSAPSANPLAPRSNTHASLPSHTAGSHDLSPILMTKTAAAPGNSGNGSPGQPALGSLTTYPATALVASQSITSSLRGGRRGERGDAQGGVSQPVVIVEPEGHEGDDRISTSRPKRTLSGRKPGTGGMGGTGGGLVTSVPGSASSSPQIPALERTQTGSRGGARSSTSFSGSGFGGSPAATALEGQLNTTEAPGNPTPSLGPGRATLGLGRNSINGNSLGAARRPQSSPYEWGLNMQLPDGRGNLLYAADASMTLDDPADYAARGEANGGGGGSFAVYRQNHTDGSGSQGRNECDDTDTLLRSAPFHSSGLYAGSSSTNPNGFGYDSGPRRRWGSGYDPMVAGDSSMVLGSAEKGVAMGVPRSPQGYATAAEATGVASSASPANGMDGAVSYQPVPMGPQMTASPCCCACCPRNPRTVFCLGLILLVVSALLAPIICVSSLTSAFRYTNTTIPDAVDDYINWHLVMYYLDDLDVSTMLYSYFGERLPPLMTVTEDEVPAFGAAWQAALSNPTSLYDRSLPKFLIGYSVDKTVNKLEEMAYDVEMRSGRQPDRVVQKQMEDIERAQEMLSTFKNGVLLAHVTSVMDHQALMSEWGAARWLRDEIGNRFYTTAAATTVARTASLLQLAKLSCYRVLACWEDEGPDGARTLMEEVELLAGLTAGTAGNVLNEILAIVADPRGEATTLEELVIYALAHSRARAELLSQAGKWLRSLMDALEAYRTPEGASGSEAEDPRMNPNFAFVVGPSWAEDLLTTVRQTLTMVTDINDLYESNSPITGWLLSGAQDVLNSDPAEKELLRAATLYNSVFAQKVGDSLTLELTEEEAAEFKEQYMANPMKTFFDETRALASESKAQAAEALKKVAALSTSETIHSVDTTALIALVLGLGLPFIVVCGMAWCLRYRVTKSPLSFPRLLALLGLCYLLAAGSAVVFYFQTVYTPRRERAFTETMLASVTETLEDVLEASNLMAKGLRLSLLIAGSVEEAERELERSAGLYKKLYDRFETGSAVLVAAGVHCKASGNWLVPMKSFLDLLLSTLEGGFDPLRQQYTRATAAQLTADALNAALDMPSVDDVIAEMDGRGLLGRRTASGGSRPERLTDTNTATTTATATAMTRRMTATLENTTAALDDTVLVDVGHRAISGTSRSCWAALSGAAENTMSTTFMSIVGVDESLYATTIALKELDRSNSFTRASMESTCFAARLAAAADPEEDGDCFVPSICNQPPDMGLLRSVDSGKTVFNVFDPSADDRLGPLLDSWRETVIEKIPEDIDALLDVMESSAGHDSRVVSAGRRMIVWGAVFVCLALQWIGLATYTALFGENVFLSLLS